MTDTSAPGAHAASAQPSYDWEAIENSPEFQELVHKRRAWVIPATIFFLAWYFGFIILAGYAEDFMGERIYEGLTVGYVLALTQFVMTFGLGFWYLRKADRDFDPLAVKAVESVLGTDAAHEVERVQTGRFSTRDRETTEEPTP